VEILKNLLKSFGQRFRAEINALVTPLEKPSPPADTGNEPVFLLWFVKAEKNASAAKEPDPGRHQRGTPQDTSARIFVPNPIAV
jgi:hypothetical protein